MGFENLFILDPSTYACDQCTVDSARKLWETLRRRSQDLAIWASRSSIQPKLIPDPSAYASDWPSWAEELWVRDWNLFD